MMFFLFSFSSFSLLWLLAYQFFFVTESTTGWQAIMYGVFAIVGGYSLAGSVTCLIYRSEVMRFRKLTKLCLWGGGFQSFVDSVLSSLATRTKKESDVLIVLQQKGMEGYVNCEEATLFPEPYATSFEEVEALVRRRFRDAQDSFYELYDLFRSSRDVNYFPQIALGDRSWKAYTDSSE